MKRYVWAVAVSMGLMAALRAAAGLPEGKVVLLGDTVSYPALGAKVWIDEAAAGGQGTTVVNASERHKSTADVAGLKTVLAANPDAAMVILMLGINDMKESYPKACAKNVGALVDEVRATTPNAQIVIVAPPTVNPVRLNAFWGRKCKFGSHTDGMMKDLAKQYRNVAFEKKVGFVDVSTVVSPEHLYDGVNVAAAGQSQIAAAVLAGLASPDLVPAEPAPEPEVKAAAKPATGEARSRLVMLVVLTFGALIIISCAVMAFFKKR